MSVPTACIVGWPIAHSRSPMVHRYWLREIGIEGDYVPLAIEPERVAGFFSAFAESGFIGGNVTVPHKEVAFASVVHADEAAAILGAVNTIWLDDGRLCGCNTDTGGFLANLDQSAPGWSEKGRGRAVVLGAGGAARGVAWGLIGRGFDPVIVINRTADRAEAIADTFGSRVVAAPWEDREAALAGADILVNTTSLGMKGQPDLELDLRRMGNDAVVCDLVYVPLQTGLLRSARERGLVAVDGLGMLLHQAVPGFEKWFGKRPAVTEELRRLVAQDILATT